MSIIIYQEIKNRVAFATRKGSLAILIFVQAHIAGLANGEIFVQDWLGNGTDSIAMAALFHVDCNGDLGIIGGGEAHKSAVVGDVFAVAVLSSAGFCGDGNGSFDTRRTYRNTRYDLCCRCICGGACDVCGIRNKNRPCRLCGEQLYFACHFPHGNICNILCLETTS